MVTAVDSFVPPPSVSQYTNAFAITQLCGVLCAPWNGLIMDRHKGKELDPGKALRQLQVAPVCSAVAADPLSLCRGDGAGGRPALLLPLPPPHLPAGPALLSLRLTSFPPAAVPHLRPTSPQPLLPLRRERGVHQRFVSSRHACTCTHRQHTFICPMFCVCVSVFQPVTLGSCAVWSCPCPLWCPCCSTPASPWSKDLCTETPST